MKRCLFFLMWLWPILLLGQGVPQKEPGMACRLTYFPEDFKSVEVGINPTFTFNSSQHQWNIGLYGKLYFYKTTKREFTLHLGYKAFLRKHDHKWNVYLPIDLDLYRGARVPYFKSDVARIGPVLHVGGGAQLRVNPFLYLGMASSFGISYTHELNRNPPLTPTVAYKSSEWKTRLGSLYLIQFTVEYRLQGIY
jgi:hypothetical protein